VKTWLWIGGGVLFLAAIVSVYLAFQRADFVAALVGVAAAYMLPKLLKRMSPEQEAAMHECERQGGVWDNVRKQCRQRLR
jgi:hypothetical protein